jgi:hypothetical protein
MDDDLTLDERSIYTRKKHGHSTGGLRGWWSELEPHTKVISIIGLVMAVIGLGYGGYLLTLKQADEASGVNGLMLNNRNPVEIAVVSPSEPRDQVSPLNGDLLTKKEIQELNQRRPLAVMIENHPDARPQTGLDQADVVIEYLAEGGITRFAGIYWTKQPEVVGPVRSIRKYVLDIVASFDDPLVMHIGGAQSTNPEADALGYIQKYGVKSLGVSGGNFWRVSDRFPPHNAYSNTRELWEKAKLNGWVGPVNISPWAFKDAKTKVDTVISSSVQVNWTGGVANPWTTVWKFDQENNVYKRLHLNEEHIDAVSNKQLTARNVMLMYAPSALANDGSSRITYNVIGSGEAVLFRDGEVIKGRWYKAGRTSPIQFRSGTDDMEFNRGITWLLVVPTSSGVTY